MSKNIGRRQFLQTGAMAAAATAAVSPAFSQKGTIAPSDQVVMGFIGTGRMGNSSLNTFCNHPGFRVAAVCDVYQPNLDLALKELKSKSINADSYKDFRELLDRDDIDAVNISSPDHWHPLMAVMACQAGKDVYVEKPISITIAEGRKMVEAAGKYKRVVQVGTQQRSGAHFQKAVKLVQDGELGAITAVRTWNMGNNFPEGWGNPPDSDPPAGLDWDFWLGPAPKVPFNKNRFGVGPDRWSTFRYFWDYAGGMMTDWGVHLIDIVQWAMKVKYPDTVYATGGKYQIKDNRETPDTLMASYQYPGFVLTYENRDCNSRPINGHGYGIEFYGTQGTMFLDRSGYEIIPETDREGDRSIPRMYSMQGARVNNSNYDHADDFYNCIKSRNKPISDIEEGHTSTAACLLANISYRTGTKLVYDGRTETIRDNPEASQLLDKEYRSPWKLEV